MCRKVIYVVLILSLFLSCSTTPNVRVIGSDSEWEYRSEYVVDSAKFVDKFHFWKGFAFISTDTLSMVSSLDSTASRMTVARNTPLIVADIVKGKRTQGDSLACDSDYVLLLASDQFTQGWISQSKAIKELVPDYRISRLINMLSDNRIYMLIVIFALVLTYFLLQTFRRERFLIVHFNDVRSVYPTLLCVSLSGMAALYGTLHSFAYDAWQSFFYAPSLNPFAAYSTYQSWLVTLFLLSIWGTLIVFIAMLDDLRHEPNLTNMVSYVVSLLGIGLLLYLVFTFAVRYYVGYPMLIAYWTWALYRHFRYNSARYACGHCGRPLKRLGRCPYCGEINE